MKNFRSYPLKLAIIDALFEAGKLKAEARDFKKLCPSRVVQKYFADNPTKRNKPYAPAAKFFQNLDIPEELLSQVKSLSFDGGNEIYRMLIPDWDGEDEQFTVRDLSDLVHLPNLQSVKETVLVDVTDAGLLLKLPRLKSVDCNYGSAIRDTKTLAALEKAGVRIENKPQAEKESNKTGPDPKLRLALDYDRAQELLWDEGKPAAALELLESILAKRPKDADSWFEKGNALDELGKRDAAAEAWLHCLTLKKKYPDAHYNLANYYKDRGDSANALSHIDAAIASGMKASPEAWHIRGQLKLASGEKQFAQVDLQKALKLYAKNLDDDDERAESLYQMACVHALLGEKATAKKLLEEACHEDPTCRKRAKDDADLRGIE